MPIGLGSNHHRIVDERITEMRVRKVTRRDVLRALLLSAVAPGAWAANPARTAHPAVRVATPDRIGTETLLSLGVSPLAVGSPSIYAAIGGTPPLSQDAVDIGYPFEPNLEILRELQPDLVVIEAMSASLKGVLEQVAPVFVMEIYGDGGRAEFVERASAEMFRLAQRIGRVDEARHFRQWTDERLQTIRKQMHGYAKRPVLIAQLDPSGRSILLYARNSVTYDVMQRIGFESAWTGHTNTYGCAQIGLDQLATVPEADLLYIDYGEQTVAALAQLAHSPVWPRLPMVRERRVYPIALFDPMGALPTAVQFAEHFQASMLARGRA
ncbi:ABC transporter substrate-binding protein [Pararobbsia silviterrae]|uniref:Fe/B12 periplasmic-binding domain-containing protein n=1 Tax=Pararobbsia silviterrae TaxID=1792498 RepID=A0A494XA46_9BURK|nr:ABC transporter substrate-binding protein [Pararobbsia silviterrae]RKP47677.1 hypothetical protein D7S86_22160 [Pararobbsia silviterrae]